MRRHPATSPAAAVLALTIAALLVGCPKKQVTCPTGETNCSGACFDLQTSPVSCGSCLHLCPSGGTCVAGQCQCPAGQIVCGDACVDPQSSQANCGGCDQPCGTGTCAGGACACGTPGDACTVLPGDGKPRCADTQNDPANCATCGNVCKPGDACVAGACTCLAPKTDCGAAGCFNLATDERHCGASCPGEACPATATCTGGVCLCPTGTVRCGNACVDLASDEANCGVCGKACPTGGTCTTGTCTCPAPTGTQCGTLPGKCVDTTTDEANCGVCGHACASGLVCTSGVCCTAGQQACGGQCFAGTGCCGATGQTAHDNGLGQAFFDCSPRDTYTRSAAIEAAQAWSPTGGTALEILECGTGCYCLQTNIAAATWCYAGNFQGLAHLNAIDVACHCPTPGFDPAWH